MATISVTCENCKRSISVDDEIPDYLHCYNCGGRFSPTNPKRSNAELFIIYSFLISFISIAILALLGLLMKFTDISTSNITKVYQQPIVKPSINSDNSRDSDDKDYQLCEVHIINILNNTDKTGTYKATINISMRTLKLTYINNPNEVLTIISKGGGVNTFQLYRNGMLESEKTMYRRNDISNSDKEIVYTSRTEQIKIIISYN